VSGLTRRRLLGRGALVVAFALSRSAMGEDAEKKPALPGDLEKFPLLDSWIRIDADGHITVFTGKAELGQGLKTALIQIAADELAVPAASIELITADVEVGQVYEGKVARLMDFGAFVTILPGRDGLVHISQISNERVERVSDKLKEGDVIRVKVLEVDRQGRIRLSMRDVEAG